MPKEESVFSRKTVGRFAPSPSGRMHLGNVYTALAAWLCAKSAGGDFLLRIEDLDPVRCPRANADQILSDLEWLGITWDNPDVRADVIDMIRFWLEKGVD